MARLAIDLRLLFNELNNDHPGLYHYVDRQTLKNLLLGCPATVHVPGNAANIVA